MNRFEEELSKITKRGNIDTAEVVDFLHKTGILKNKGLYLTFLLFMEQCNHNGYLDAFEFIKEQQEMVNDGRK